MTRILLVLLCLIVMNCEDKQSRKNTNTKAIDSSTVNIEKKPVQKKDTVQKAPERKYPLLTDKNAMEFFLQYEKEHKENKVRMVTDFGNIDILLFNETKFHRANFIFLTKQGYFDNTQFYRVIENYIVQGGSTDDRKVMRKRNDIGRYLLPTDTKRGFHHDRGVISMPSSDIDNPYKLASPYEFFITLRDVYELDGDYTIFGRVINGLDVCDRIAEVETDDGDWPLRNVYIRSVEILD
ncbi:peptidylprolyl isomerase [Psychroserpens sp. XS_ASV72]|uniref:peptidylprolyl isomerase n=1 Tax=Psychroserpens sp. XS_ASV72 TaxID=3241293 RepID=UPI003518D37B